MSRLTDIYCPACDRQHLDSLMISEQLGYRCQLQSHRYEYQRLMSLKPRMKEFIVVEKQPGGTVVQPMWVHPEAWARLQEKYRSNLMTTICSLLTSLADGDTMVIEGEHVRELASLGITKGRELMGLASANISMSNEIKEARFQLRALEPILKALGGAGAAAIAAQSAPGTEQEPGASTATNLPPRAPQVQLQPDPDGDYNPIGYMTDATMPRSPAQQPAAQRPESPAVRGIPRPGAPSNLR